MPNDCLLALTTCPDTDSAAHLARALVEERLAACVTRLPGATSTYHWQDAVQEDAEILLLVKSTQAHLPALRERLTTLHPYEVPEWIVVPIVDGLPAYLDWLRQSLAQGSSD